MIKGNTTSAVIVTYQPNETLLNNLIKTLTNQVEYIIIVDNASNSCFLKELVQPNKTNINLIPLPFNVGIAKALNIGIYEATKTSDFVIFFDQDSDPEKGLVKTLLHVFYEAKTNNNICAVGPQFFDSRTGEKSSFYSEENHNESLSQRETPDWVLADHLITSGSLIPISIFSSIGYMKESLFIDLVDIEWCLRAKSKGFTCIGTSLTTMTHSIGLDIVNIGKFHIYKHTLTRYYYQIRNRVWLCQQPYVLLSWRIRYGFRIPFLALLYIYYSSNKLKTFKYMLLALYHGLFNRLGKL
ncbi:MAG: glycosyltransferase family 2 protein [Mariprofundaceae bacterium]|nr:glycosyltransferase family 2 protein [Mariprofundaceae bacterium]